MKIFFPIGRFYPSQVGGPCNTVYWHTCALKNNGITTSIITTGIGIKKGLVDLDISYDDNCSTVYYGSGSEMNFKTFKKLRKELKSSDIIHLNSLFSLFSIYCFFYSRVFLRSKKIIISVRGELSPSALKYSKVKKKMVLFLYKFFNKGVLYHSTSDRETQEIKEIFSKVDVINIPNFIAPAARLERVPKKEQFLFVGRIHPIKAIDKLLEGLLKSSKFKKSDFKLVIAGVHEARHQDYYNHLITLIEEFEISDQVNFVGHVNKEKKEELYAESFFTFLPSETENFGNVVLESLNQGTPVVASLGTPWSILEDYKSGFHVSNDPQVLANKVDELLELDSEIYTLMQEGSKKLIDDRYNVENRIVDWIKVYESLLS